MANFIITDNQGNERDFQVNGNGYLKTWCGPDYGYEQVFTRGGAAISCTPETLEKTVKKYLKRCGAL